MCFREPSEWLPVIMNSAGLLPRQSLATEAQSSQGWEAGLDLTCRAGPVLWISCPPARKIRTLPDFWGYPLLRESDSFKLPEAFLKHLTNLTELPYLASDSVYSEPHTLFLSRSPFSPFLALFQHSLPRVLFMHKNHWSWPVCTQLASLFLQALAQAA